MDGETRVKIGMVVIGRDEGERLKACLRSASEARALVYVDSGSLDGSVEYARQHGVAVVALSTPPAFSAARARNAGLKALLTLAPDIDAVQMIDGDCILAPGWLEIAAQRLRDEPDLAIVFGRTRERYPDRSIYNALCDDEWNVPIGEASGCGGNACIRVSGLENVGGYDEEILAGEDSEMSWRVRQAGGKVWHVSDEMAEHDAEISTFRQWWLRTKRGGHGYAQLAHLHPDSRSPDWRRACHSIMVWGGAVPALIVLGLGLAATVDSLWSLLSLSLVVALSAKILQIAMRKKRQGLPLKVAAAAGLFLMIGKLPQLFGVIRFHKSLMIKKRSSLIEYRKLRD